MLPPGVSQAEVAGVLAKALKWPVAQEDRALASAVAIEQRAELTGLMGQLLPQYEQHFQLLSAEIRRRRGKPRQAALAARTKLKQQVEWQLRTHIFRYYRDQFAAGKQIAGSAKPIDRAEQEIIRRVANSEAQYALNAMLDAETGEYTMALERRGVLYGNALDELKWLGWLYGDLSQDRYVRWVLNPAEHCISCLWLAGELDWLEAEISDRAAARPSGEPTATEQRLLDLIAVAKPTQGGRWGTGVYRAQELVRMAIVPQSGRLTCTTNCKCHLEEATRPAGKIKQPEQREPFVDLTQKVPTMLQRETEVEQREKLAQRAEEKWRHEHQKRTEVIPVK
jgi:hypothetical protein